MRFVAGLLVGLLLGGAAPTGSWPGYQIIEYQARNEAQLATLKQLGVTAGMAFADRENTLPPVEQRAAALINAGLPWYVENVATDFYAPYHRWRPDRPVNALFIEAQRRALADRSDLSVFVRTPSLSDPVWQQRIRDRLTATVRRQTRYRPLFYSLGDETGIADLAAFWDFDLAPESLTGFRSWLRQRYGDLDVLNAEWGTSYARWDDVGPMLTDEALRRADGNFAAWADFKDWMDGAFACALRQGTDSVHAADAVALAGIGGAQIPGWGGYDYTRLARAVDLMEVYDSGENLPIVLSLNPGLVTLSTTFGADPASLHAIWREWLRGTRGLILWDDDSSIVAPDGTLGARGRAYAPVFAELRGRLGSLLIGSQRVYDPVAILYSPASFRTQWLLDRQAKGDDWRQRGSEIENEDNAVRAAMRGYAQTLAHRGITPRWVTPEQVAAGALGGARALILPHGIALSEAEARAIGTFQGAVIGDAPAGLFDQHSRRRDKPLIAPTLVAPEDADGLMRQLAAAGIVPAVVLDATDVATYVFRYGGTTILALQRDVASPTESQTVTLHFEHPTELYDLRRQQPVGRAQAITLTLDPVAPTILTIGPQL
jgi:hypothetical protein